MSRKNYTEREKRELLSIVDKYKGIIENKSTNAVTVEKKINTWEIIAQEYNSSAENPRSAKQLNTAYQNMKRLTRQRTADENQRHYMEKKTEMDLKQFKKDKAEDKKGIMATGGGSYTPQLSEVGAQMLALMGDQLKPLSNNYDSASAYFKTYENEDETNYNEITDTMQTVITIHTEPSLEDIEVSAEPQVESDIMPPKEVQEMKKKPWPSTPSSSRLKNRPHGINLKQKNKFKNSSAIKMKFYKKKLECALLEKKTNLVNYRIALKKEKLVDLEIKIKQLEYSNQSNKFV